MASFVDFLEQAYRQQKLQLERPLEPLRHPLLFEGYIDRLYRNDWVVYAKEPFARPEAVLRYLARYTHRAAISNDRQLDIDNDHVVFRYRDYAAGGCSRVMSLDAMEFIRRFLQHVLPRRFVRIRYFGLLAHRSRKTNLDRARELLEANADESLSGAAELLLQPAFDPLGCTTCPKCAEGNLRRHRKLPGGPFTSPRGPP